MAWRRGLSFPTLSIFVLPNTGCLWKILVEFAVLVLLISKKKNVVDLKRHEISSKTWNVSLYSKRIELERWENRWFSNSSARALTVNSRNRWCFGLGGKI